MICNMKKHDIAKKMKGASNDKRFNAEKYVRGVKPSKHSEYFGTSYSELKRKSGKESLNTPKGEKNMGEKMYLGKNENNRA